ncbi:MAG TPA: hypothetical protein P5028_04245 [Candidatus Marinimicrobia bacterium]|jgi:hypothetical protein|nr:hypothetical protein [Candidatus Neomarinimicrobiota bacterium]HQC63118.1 hypothetical protein [Candidatus Neomarinimicrobiota bacterium]HQE94607.1 hypothetical protein [Candidatus Neomarinimicrobiota bacterium]HRS91242.1 hypothetical protein [Candidatus Neomarinimicrobiota bacterium]
MKNLVLISGVLGVLTFLMGVITQLVGHSILFCAASWNSLTQTMLLFAIAFAVWEHEKCKCKKEEKENE